MAAPVIDRAYCLKNRERGRGTRPVSVARLVRPLAEPVVLLVLRFAKRSEDLAARYRWSVLEVLRGSADEPYVAVLELT